MEGGARGCWGRSKAGDGGANVGPGGVGPSIRTRAVRNDIGAVAGAPVDSTRQTRQRGQ